MEPRDRVLNFLIILASSFFAAFSVSLNKKAKDEKISFLMMASEILVHGVSGGIIGLISTKFISDDIFIVAAISAIGGMVGSQVVHFVAKVFMISFATAKNVKIDDIDKIDLDGDK